MTPLEFDPAATQFCIVMTTTDSEANADDLAERIVQSGLAACVQIVPIKSVYRWQGQVRREGEWLLLAKTTAARFAELDRFINATHTYETPEVVVVPITGGSAHYLRWLAG